MKRKNQIIGMIILLVCSIIYDFKKPEVIHESEEKVSFVILEGEFLISGKYEFSPPLTVSQLIHQVGITSSANKEALPMNEEIQDEMRIYLPKIGEHLISLNKATLEELKTLSGIGDKTAQKIIDYRKKNLFVFIEDIMKITGIGEKTYIRLRDFICL